MLEKLAGIRTVILGKNPSDFPSTKGDSWSKKHPKGCHHSPRSGAVVTGLIPSSGIVLVVRRINPKHIENPHEQGPSRRKKLVRIDRPAIARYLTFSCDQQLPLLGNARLRDHFTRHLATVRASDTFLLFAWVIMPEHVHLLLKPLNEAQRVDRILWALKRNFAIEIIGRWRELRAPILKRLTGPDSRVRFWQRGGYDRRIFSQDEFGEKVDYIHANPVRRGLVKSPGDWMWSSARAYGGMESLVPTDRRMS